MTYEASGKVISHGGLLGELRGGTTIKLAFQGYLRSGKRLDRQAGRGYRLTFHPGGHLRVLVLWCVCRQGVTSGNIWQRQGRDVRGLRLGKGGQPGSLNQGQT